MMLGYISDRLVGVEDVLCGFLPKMSSRNWNHQQSAAVSKNNAGRHTAWNSRKVVTSFFFRNRKILTPTLLTLCLRSRTNKCLVRWSDVPFVETVSIVCRGGKRMSVWFSFSLCGSNHSKTEEVGVRIWDYSIVRCCIL